jgi:hypothetical protein
MNVNLKSLEPVAFIRAVQTLLMNYSSDAVRAHLNDQKDYFDRCKNSTDLSCASVPFLLLAYQSRYDLLVQGVAVVRICFLTTTILGTYWRISWCQWRSAEMESAKTLLVC